MALSAGYPNMNPRSAVLLAMTLFGLVSSIAACAGDGDPQASTSPRLEERPEWSPVFTDAGTRGTFVVREVGTSTVHGVNGDRASVAYLPASTFKILNSAIFLETGVVGSVDTVLEWDGMDRGVDVWNRDHTLRSAIEASAVWVFQHHARAVRAERMLEHLEAADYGNAELGEEIDRFWLDGDLRVTALEQLDMLEQLMTDELPFASEHQAAVRDILIRESGDGWQWLHKTGTALAETPTLGWLVGATNHDGRSWVFALNLDLMSIDEEGLASQIDPHVRIDIARRLLVDVGALPAPALV